MNPEQQKARVAVLDICGTLAPEDSWLALTRDLGASVNKHQDIYHAFRDGAISYEESKRQLLGMWQATGRANRTVLEQIFRSWPLDDAAPALVNRLRAAGYVPVLITGSVDLYAAIVSSRLTVPDWYANTVLRFDSNGNLIDYDYDLDQSGKKLRQLEHYCAQHGMRIDEALAIGDGPNDTALFAAVNRAILVTSGSDAGFELSATVRRCRSLSQALDEIGRL